jgi:NTP pyrophosphatase (non-canonical NTP hydrolase)
MYELDALLQEIISFRDERNWKQFHDSKNLALAISIEASELNELFLWKNGEEAEGISQEKLKDELADILIYCLLLSHKHNLDMTDIIREKIQKNALRYPVEKAKGVAKKYNEL